MQNNETLDILHNIIPYSLPSNNIRSRVIVLPIIELEHGQGLNMDH